MALDGKASPHHPDMQPLRQGLGLQTNALPNTGTYGDCCLQPDKSGHSLPDTGSTLTPGGLTGNVAIKLSGMSACKALWSKCPGFGIFSGACISEMHAKH